jgi:hypothetical protein
MQNDTLNFVSNKTQIKNFFSNALLICFETVSTILSKHWKKKHYTTNQQMLCGSIGESVGESLDGKFRLDKIGLDKIGLDKISLDKIGFDKTSLGKKKRKKITPEYYDKCYDILYKHSDMENDPYGRGLNKSSVKQFCKVALDHKIDINTEITDELFDLVYFDFVKYQMMWYQNKQYDKQYNRQYGKKYNKQYNKNLIKEYVVL